MKVLEKKPFWVFRCEGCRSKLEADITDVKVGEFGGNWCEDGETNYYVPCPICGEANVLPEEMVTTLVIREVKKKRRS